MFASRIPSTQLRKAAMSSKPIGDLCVGYNETLLQQARVTAACNALHPVEERFCRWLLQTRDRAESDTILLTQEFLSEMLGVRRTSVTEVAIKIQTSGTISYSRGVIKILDLDALKASRASATKLCGNRLLLNPRRSGFGTRRTWRNV
jgi:CRP-like cAMP-binding protein